MKFLLLASVAGFVLPVAMVPSAAFAQQAPAENQAPVASQSAAVADVNEIIVTATRRSQLLSDVPIAVSAVTAEALQNSGGSDIRQLNQLAPSLLVSSATSESNGAARIRGIGTVGENPGLESSVAVFIDGVYRSRTGVGLSDLGPIQSIEVLRGPQGTLFGRNASAGLISITTAKPKFDFGGQGEVTYGNFNNIRVQGGLTGPIFGDKVAFRIDGLYNKRDGFVTDVISGRKLNDRDRYLIRGQLLIQPSDDLSIRLIGDYSSKDEECCAAAIIAPTANLSRDANGNVISSPNSVRALITSLGGVFNLPTDGSKYAYRTSITPGSGYFQRTRDWGVSGELNYDFGIANLTSITAYREYRNKSAQDADFNNIDLLRRSDQNRKFQTFTQEVRLQGKAFDDRLDFLVGGYYAHETLRTDDNLVYGNDFEAYYNAQFASFNPVFGAANTGKFLTNYANAVGYVPPAGQSVLNNTGIVQGGFFKQTSNNYAIFTHNVISIVPDKLLLTLGGRYTRETKELVADFRSNNNFCGYLRGLPAGAVTGTLAALRPTVTSVACIINNTPGANFTNGTAGTKRSEGEFTGTAVLSYKPVDRLLAYVSYSRGYKAGGFNLDTSALNGTNPQAVQLQFAPEIVNSFEAGAKLDLRQFKFNAALFYAKFDDFQLNTFNGVNFEVSNIEGCSTSLNGLDRDLIAGNSACTGKKTAGVISKGVELEAVLYPFPDFTMTAGVTYTDTRYAKNLAGRNGVSLAPTLFQLPGQTLSNSSEYVVTGSAAWTPRINENLSGLLYFDFRSTSALNTGSDLDFEKIQPAFVTANARIGIYGKDRRWGLEFWGQNIFNTIYQQVAADDPLQGSGTYRAVARGLSATANQLFITFPAEPRTYGVTLRGKF